ncbi:MAG: helix-turn-helix domain-containing protein [Sphingomonas sp.]
MTEGENSGQESLFPKRAGEQLAEAREAMGLSLAEIAARTRIPLRHLEAIETSNYAAMPSHTYAIGFAKAYARLVGVDEAMVGRDIRENAIQPPRPTASFDQFDNSNPARLPPRGLGIIVAVVAVLLLVGIAVVYGTNWFGTDQVAGPVVASAVLPDAAREDQAPDASGAAPPVTGSGQVSLIATDVVWLRIYDATRKSIHEGELKAGERYDVPADIAHPLINIGRPDKVQITVNGSAVPPLGDGKRALKDVEISAAALLARTMPSVAPPIAPSAAP